MRALILIILLTAGAAEAQRFAGTTANAADTQRLITLNRQRIADLDRQIADALKAQREKAAKGETGANDLAMIQLQSLVSRRQRLVQLTTDMLAGLNAGQDAIVRNIGR